MASFHLFKLNKQLHVYGSEPHIVQPHVTKISTCFQSKQIEINNSLSSCLPVVFRHITRHLNFDLHIVKAFKFAYFMEINVKKIKVNNKVGNLIVFFFYILMYLFQGIYLIFLFPLFVILFRSIIYFCVVVLKCLLFQDFLKVRKSSNQTRSSSECAQNTLDKHGALKLNTKTIYSI